MAQSLRIDTLKLARKLTNAGLDARVAEVIAEALFDARVEDRATGTDPVEVRPAVGADLALRRTDLAEFRALRRTDLAELKAELLNRLWIMAALTVGLNVTLVKLLT